MGIIILRAFFAQIFIKLFLLGSAICLVTLIAEPFSISNYYSGENIFCLTGSLSVFLFVLATKIDPSCVEAVKW